MNYTETILERILNTVMYTVAIAITMLLFVFALAIIVALFTVSDPCSYAGGDYIEVVEPQMCYSPSQDKYLPLSR
jgi:ABC-type amino acid transport system permease subunit